MMEVVAMIINIFEIFVVVCVLLLVIVTLSTVMWFVSSRWRLLNALGNSKRLPIAAFIFACLLGLTRLQHGFNCACCKAILWFETKTKDNVFVMMNVATQYRVNEQSVTDAYYKLMRPESQIKSYIEDALRSSVPKLTLDELFEKKDEIALEVQHQVAEEIDYLRLYYRENL